MATVSTVFMLRKADKNLILNLNQIYIYSIEYFGLQRYEYLTSVVYLFTFSVLQGLAEADSMPSSKSNLSGTHCRSSKVSNSESQLTISEHYS